MYQRNYNMGALFANSIDGFDDLPLANYNVAAILLAALAEPCRVKSNN